MSKKPPQTEWNGDVRRAVRKFAAAGIREAAPTPLFDWCDHVTVAVEGLEGVGVIHQRSAIDPYRLCVFEPSEREAKGFVEVFERTLKSLDELPQKVAEWRSFRSAVGPQESTAGLQDHRKWLGAVAREKSKLLDAVRESGRLREAGDMEGAWQAAGFDVNVGPALPADTPPLATQRLLADFQAIAPDLLAWHFPRDDKGKWPLSRRSPLYRYDGDKRRMSVFCLLVAMPEKRSGRPEIRAEWLQADLQTARLDAVPEKFDTRVMKDFTPELLGLNSGQARNLWSGQASSECDAAQVMRLQYDGEFQSAAMRAGLELDDVIIECMKARRVAHMCTCCAPLDRQLIEWAAILKKTLTELNFNRAGPLALRDQTRCGRKPRKEPIPIVPFPLQRHIRKAHIALDIRNGLRPRLTIDTTGSGNRLPLALWRRPEDIDLLHEGLLKNDDLPEPVKAQL